MAVGVPENDVYQAADAVLARGERPTVERVRTELGRGSPARVGQLLEQWWEQLAQRLKGHALLPELPGEVAQAFIEAWRIALAHGEGTAQATLAIEQNALYAERTSLAQERKVWDIALAEAQASVAEHATQRALAERQLGERQSLVEQQAAQISDLTQQRDRLQAHVEQVQTELAALRVEHAAAHEHIRRVEDRAHQQVDRARQDLKSLQQEHQREQRLHEQRLATLTEQNAALQAAVRTAEQATARYEGRVAALETTLKQARAPQAVSKRVQFGAKAPAKRTRPRKD
jgi:hypothetical protein